MAARDTATGLGLLPQLDALLQQRDLKVLSFVGYSASGYEDPVALLDAAARVLDAYLPAHTAVNIGATPSGIGAVYPLARARGFCTIGIVSSQARREAVAMSSDVQHVFEVEDSVWGGWLPQPAGLLPNLSPTLSPTSQAIVAYSSWLVAIGGGQIAAAEWQCARAAGKPVRFIAADMNHALARQRAASRGLPPPQDFRGAVHAAWQAVS